MINLDLLSLSLVPARIANISKDVTVNEGSNVNLMCQAVGRPDASIIWKYHSPRGRLQGVAVYLAVFGVSLKIKITTKPTTFYTSGSEARILE